MNSITKFFHELFTPHCQHCADERREQREESKYCSSCESLERENSRLVRENERLLSLVLNKKEPEEKAIDTSELKPIHIGRPFIPAAVRRQTLEAESRHQLKLQREAPKPDAPIIDKDVELESLEAELNDARQRREAKATVNT